MSVEAVNSIHVEYRNLRICR